jgi:glycerophosphoryl diester phosphodiesterase
MRSSPRLKWHKLRRRRSDPAFLRANLVAGLRVGAALEVDLVVTADGHFVCLHDLTLDAETTGQGDVSAATREQVAGLRQRGPDGRILDTPPLFLDEIVAAVAQFGSPTGGLVQLDIKEPAARFDKALAEDFARTIGALGPRFIASGCEPGPVALLRDATPGLAGGFDPLDMYASGLPGTAAGFEQLARDTLRAAPDAAIYYLEADLVLQGLSLGVNLVERVTGAGAEVDAWTVDANRPGLGAILDRLTQAGVNQITSNDPDELATMLQEIV